MTTTPDPTLLDRVPSDPLADIRQQALAAYQRLGWPSFRDEAWRYTDTRPLAKVRFAAPCDTTSVTAATIEPFLFRSDEHRLVFVNGVFAEDLSTHQVHDGVRVERLAEALAQDCAALRSVLTVYADHQDDPATALGTALMRDGIFVDIDPKTELKAPIHIMFVNQGETEPVSIHPRVVVRAGDHSRGTVIESHVGTTGHTVLTTPVTELVAGDHVHLDHYRMVREGEGTWHLGDVAIHQGAGSEVSSCVLAFEGPLIRTRMRGTLAGPDGNTILHGLALVDGTRHVENLLRVNHNVPHCRSRESFKHVLNDRATAAFTGRIFVAEGAQKTDAVQTNRNLLLSDSAKSTARPQLEIYADDVKCTHGATCGELDPEAMFYLQARGIPAEAARSMLVQAFAGEILDDIGPDELRKQAQELLQERLPAAEHLAVVD